MKLKVKFTIMLWGIIILAILITGAVGTVVMTFLDDMDFFAYYRVRKQIHREFAQLSSETDFMIDPGSVLPNYLGYVVLDSGGSVLYSAHPEFRSDLAFDPSDPDSRDVVAQKMFDMLSDYQVILEFTENESAGLKLIFYSLMERMPEAKVGWRPVLFMFVMVIFLSSLMGAIFLRKTDKSIGNLERATREIAQGNLDFQLVASGDDEIAALSRSFETMRQGLKEELARRSRFLMAVSHDLKTPLTSIDGYLEAIEDGLAKDEETLNKYLGIIGDKAQILESRILELIDFVKMETGEWQLKGEVIDLKQFLTSLCEAFSDDAQVLRRVLTCHIDIADGTMVPGDPSLLGRVLENLFNNAVRYTQDDNTIEIAAWPKAQSIFVEVRDSGPGIDEDELPLIFDPFFRGTRTRNEQGFGLGLSIVKSIVQSHGFSITARSGEGMGTVFTITIPV